MDNYNFEPSFAESAILNRERAQAAMLLNGYKLSLIKEIFSTLEEFKQGAIGTDLEGYEEYLWESSQKGYFI